MAQYCRYREYRYLVFLFWFVLNTSCEGLTTSSRQKVSEPVCVLRQYARSLLLLMCTGWQHECEENWPVHVFTPTVYTAGRSEHKEYPLQFPTAFRLSDQHFFWSIRPPLSCTLRIHLKHMHMHARMHAHWLSFSFSLSLSFFKLTHSKKKTTFKVP